LCQYGTNENAIGGANNLTATTDVYVLDFSAAIPEFQSGIMFIAFLAAVLTTAVFMIRLELGRTIFNQSTPAFFLVNI
jgi:hypothetical protein